MNTSREAPGRTSGRAPGPADPGPDPLAALSLDDKVRLLTGADNWRTCPLPAIGLRAMVVSDGPAGVRGVTMDERNPAASLPCPSPLGGRGFESFGEDPVLIGRMAVAFVRGLRQAGVAAAVKHYVGNDSETGRWTYDARIAEHVLREVYLAPFEACVREADVDLVMTGYNKVNGVTMTEHGSLLGRILKEEWGFGGVALSDWHAARSTVATAVAGLDLAMPGPSGPWGGKLAAAVRAGTVSEAVVDAKVRRILRLARRVGALGGPRALVDRVVARRLLGPGWTSRMMQAMLYELLTDPESVAQVAAAGERYAQRQRERRRGAPPEQRRIGEDRVPLVPLVSLSPLVPLARRAAERPDPAG